MKRETELKARAWILTCGYLVLIFGVSSIPQAAIHVTPFQASDKLAHLAEYAGFGLLLTVALRRSWEKMAGLKLTIVAVGIGAGLGILDELYQMTVPGRTLEFLDWLADVAGALIGNWAAMTFYKRRRLRRHGSESG